MKKLGSGVLFLTIAGVGAKLIGALYRVPLTNALGAEGMGYYQSVFPVYALLFILSSGGISVAVSRLVATELVGGCRKNAQGILKSALIGVGGAGLLASVILYFISSPLASLQGVPSAEMGYKVIAPAVLFSGLTAATRGYFQGTGNFRPTAVSQLIEQLVKLCAGLYLAISLSGKGVAVSAAGALMGVTISELFALAYMSFRLIPEKIGVLCKAENGLYSFCRTFRAALPITLGGIINPLSLFADSFIVVNILGKSAGAVSAAGSYGVWSGPVSSLVNLPVVLTVALSVAIVPALAARRPDGGKVNFAFRICFASGVLFAVLYFAFSDKIFAVLYPSLKGGEVGSTLLKIASLNVLFLTLNQIFTAFLQGIGLESIPMKNLLCAAVLKIVLSLILLPPLGIYGAAISSVVSYGILCLLGGAYYVKFSKKVKQSENGSRIPLVGVIIFIIGCVINGAFATRWALLAVLPLSVVYVALLFIMRAFTADEFLIFKRSKRGENNVNNSGNGVQSR